MVNSGGSRRRAGNPGKRSTRPAKKKSATAPPAAVVVEFPASFRLGMIPGATPGKWIDTWRERVPQSTIELVALSVADQRGAVSSGEVDAALIRLPIEREGLNVIPLYDEVSVVVASADSHLTAADDLELADLEGEVVIVPQDDVLQCEVPGSLSPRFAAPVDTAEAIATVAAGVGIVIVPMSLARQHHRKDTAYRVLRDGPISSVALAWRAGDENPAVSTFMGIVRGRTANSSRS